MRSKAEGGFWCEFVVASVIYIIDKFCQFISSPLVLARSPSVAPCTLSIIDYINVPEWSSVVGCES